MPFGQQAYENSHQTVEVVDQFLRADIWDNNIEEFVCLWSGCLWLTIDGMHERVESVFANVLNATNPDVETIRNSLKTKNSRWETEEVNRIAPIVHHYLVRNNNHNVNQFEHHTNFQNDLGEIGPVQTIWCHYLVEPMAFPPIDRFNYAAWSFVTQPQQNIPRQVPNNFGYLPIGAQNTDYQNFRGWFQNVLNIWRNGNHTLRDVVDLDRSLMSLGAFILRNNARHP